ncbi:cytochrome P450 family protein [Ceratobasidium sp. AG-Ba]|nr:cytochrome P450 family protein [Ceratobasidium sp. AG-Ba]
MNYLQVADLLLVAVCVLFYARVRYKRPSRPLPPSPPKHPLLGNLRDIPKQREWVHYAKMSKELQSVSDYMIGFTTIHHDPGDVISLSALGKTIIVLNSHRSVMDLLEKRAIYADRPVIPMISDEKLMGLGDIIQFARYGPRLRQLRKAIHTDMQESAIPNYWPSQIKEAQRLVARLRNHGDEHLINDIQQWAAASILSDTYGYELPEDTSDDPLLQIIEELIRSVARGVSSARFLVNLFPILKHVPEWMPGANFKVFARRARELKERVQRTPFERVKAEIARGTARSCYVSRSLLGFDPSQHNAGGNKALHQDSYEEIIRSNAGAMFGAGSDTTVSTLRSFFIAMQLYPDIQTRARQEVLGVIDPVTGTLDPAVILQLEYLQRVLKETLRWLPALPLGLPHAVIEDDKYRGYHIPSGSIILPNHWYGNDSPYSSLKFDASMQGDIPR